MIDSCVELLSSKTLQLILTRFVFKQIPVLYRIFLLCTWYRKITEIRNWDSVPVFLNSNGFHSVSLILFKWVNYEKGKTSFLFLRAYIWVCGWKIIFKPLENPPKYLYCVCVSFHMKTTAVSNMNAFCTQYECFVFCSHTSAHRGQCGSSMLHLSTTNLSVRGQTTHAVDLWSCYQM